MSKTDIDGLSKLAAASLAAMAKDTGNKNAMAVVIHTPEGFIIATNVTDGSIDKFLSHAGESQTEGNPERGKRTPLMVDKKTGEVVEPVPSVPSFSNS